MTAASRRTRGAGATDVQEAPTAQARRGYIGESPATMPTSAFGLRSGPDSPTAAEQHAAAAQAHADSLKKAARGG